MRLTTPAMLGCLILGQACAQEQPESPHGAYVKLLSPQLDALNDSIGTVLRAYEGGTVTLSEASRHLADLLEPVHGMATSRPVSPRADELLHAATLELQRRNARKYGLPDSLAR